MFNLMDQPVFQFVTYLVDDLVQDHVLVDLERVAEHVLAHGRRLDLAQRHRLLLDVVLVVAHRRDRQRVHLQVVTRTVS